MGTWQYSIGNLARRAPSGPAAVAPAVEDSLYPLANLADDYPDTLGALEWRSDGAYDIDFDVNLLALSSERSDAPTGWSDLLNVLAGTPGLPGDPPDWGDYGSRTSVLRFFRPTFQDIDVMPAEDVRVDIGLYRPSGATGSTGTRCRVVDLGTGKGWNGTAWADGGVLLLQSTADAWSDVQEVVTADTNRTRRTTYRVIVEPVASSYDSTSYGYASLYATNGSPAVIPEADLVAIIGHNIPDDATVALGAISMSPEWPAFYAVDTPAYAQTWRLSIDMPSGNEARPMIGEVWIGQARSFTVSPQLSMRLEEADADQIRLEAARRRLEVIGDEQLPPAVLQLPFRVAEDDYIRVRDELTRLTRFGAEPMLLIPTADFEGARFYHGRLGSRVIYSRLTVADSTEAWRAFTLEFSESPLHAA